MYGRVIESFLFSGVLNVYHFACVWPTALKLGSITNFDMLFLVMGFISLVDEIQFMLISSRHICIRSITTIRDTNFRYVRWLRKSYALLKINGHYLCIQFFNCSLWKGLFWSNGWAFRCLIPNWGPSKTIKNKTKLGGNPTEQNQNPNFGSTTRHKLKYSNQDETRWNRLPFCTDANKQDLG